MKGDPADIVARLRLALPRRWFGDTAPVMDGLLGGLASAWSGLHGLLQEVRRQSRMTTATGGFLDLAALDLFGGGLPRRAGEADGAFLARIGRALRRVRATRAGLVDAAGEAGSAARVFEPARPTDTGVYGGPGLAWGVAGGWGSLMMPLECLVVLQPDTPEARAALVVALPAGGVAWVRGG